MRRPAETAPEIPLTAAAVPPAAETVARPLARPLALLALGHMVIDIHQGALPALLPFLKNAFGLSYAAAGTVILAANLTSSVIQPLFGYLSDRSARRWLLPWALVFTTLGMGFTGLVSSYALLLVLVVVAGLGIAAYHPEGYRTAHQVAGARKATGLAFFSIGGNLGIALGPPLVAALVTAFGLPGTLGMLVPGLAMAGLLTVALPALALVGPASAGAGGPTTAGRAEMRGAMLLLIAVVTLRSWAQLGLTAFVPFFYVDHLGAEPWLAGPLLFAFLGSGAVGTLVGGPLADRWGPRRYIVLALLVAAPLASGFVLARGWPAYLLLAGTGFALVSTFSVTVVLAQTYLPRRLGMAAGLIVGFAIGTGGIGVALLGWVADHWGLPVTMGVLAAMPLLGALLAALLPEPRP
ncbi:MAG: MFS transporter [Candidatus Rokubacteria bacterium]|nr:MFS transporter [Candidatus Rokubacteria bacterium]